MKVKSAFYAAVGAPVVAARKVGDKTNEVYGKLNDKATGYGETANKALDGWAVEGEKVVVRVKDGKVVDEITSKVDLDQAKEQVSKLRDQLEDMLATWRSSFRPEKVNGEEAKTEAKTTEKKAAAKSTASGATAAKASTAKTGTAKASTAKASSAKSTTSKASAAKTTKSTAAKTGAAKTASDKEETSAKEAPAS